MTPKEAIEEFKTRMGAAVFTDEEALELIRFAVLRNRKVQR